MRFQVDDVDFGVAIAWDQADGGREGFGFEGGRVARLDDGYHLFTTELLSRPIWVKTCYAHWFSSDGSTWSRESTVMESTGDYTGVDQSAALFSPMPIFSGHDQRWYLFYVAYRSLPDTPQEFLRNHHGHVMRAPSLRPGIAGIGGPYGAGEVILRPGPGSQAWEGLQGTDSFFPFETASGWSAFYGSATTEYFGGPMNGESATWSVGIATSPTLAGRWTRAAAGNPLDVEPVFIENPIVTKLADGTYVAVYENDAHDPQFRRSFGMMSSRDGLTWLREPPIMLPDSVAPWVYRVRTPLGLIEEQSGFRMYFTGFFESGAEAAAEFRSNVGMITGVLRS